LTGVSNRASFALFDVLVAALALWLLGAFVRDVAARRQRGWTRTAARTVGRTAVLAAAVYLLFLVTWGFNYRRPPLGDRLALDMAQATPEAARALAMVAVEQLNALHAPAHAAPRRDDDVDPDLAAAFAEAQSRLGVDQPARPARPKRTWLDPYFRAAGVDGLTAPFFAETLVPSDLLEVERPVIVAHEWGHLAGFADEGEAGFLAWLTCFVGPAPIRYSGWLSVYGDALRVLPRREREVVMAALGPGPIADLRAMAERRSRNVNRTVSRAGWRAYDQYLRANRVESGTASYGEALRLVLGTKLGRGMWEGNAER